MNPNDPAYNENAAANTADNTAENARQDSIAVQNIERLLSASYDPEVPNAEFLKRVQRAMLDQAQHQSSKGRTASPGMVTQHQLIRQIAGFALAVSLLLAVVFLVNRVPQEMQKVSKINAIAQYTPSPELPRWRTRPRPPFHPAVYLEGSQPLHARRSEPAPQAEPAKLGQTITTKSGQRRRVTLADGSVLYLNENTSVAVDAPRQVTLNSGEIYVEVSPRKPAKESNKKSAQDAATFLVKTPGRDISALGTKFAVKRTGAGTGVLVVQGKVKLSDRDLPLSAGQQLFPRPGEKTALVSFAPRASHALDWTRDLVTAASAPLVPKSKHAGGSLVAVDPDGQETRFSLRKYHVDVHIEDGFARTTIDQTYFNHLNSRLEGTFRFPLPPDASISRLAMYVNGRLMEGGMVERNYGRQVFESIKYRMLDPALLEWVDGSTFKMRVFPLEPREEKRIVISYTQRLESIYGQTKYRFPSGHSLGNVGRWSVKLRVRNGKDLDWNCATHELEKATSKNDLILSTQAKNITPTQDLVLSYCHPERSKGSRLTNGGAACEILRCAQNDQTNMIRVSSALHEGSRYLMLRYRPRLETQMRRQRRDWVFLFESSADRNPLLARTQIDILRTILGQAEHNDTFIIITAGSRATKITPEPLAATPKNISTAIEKLERTHLVGALDLENALAATQAFIQKAEKPVLVHLGSATAALGQRADEKLIAMIPKRAQYVGVGVGKRWNRNFMKTAAGRSGGYFTRINPDEPVSWRTFELVSTLNTPRLLEIKVTDLLFTGKKPGAEKNRWLIFADWVSQGEELCTVMRLDDKDRIPSSVTISGTLDGENYSREVVVDEVAADADYLPRMWAKLEIDRLVAAGTAGTEKHRKEIIELSKNMYVMSPLTSLLVLENEAMYKQYKVDRGRKDHWALYPCPENIPVVHEPLKRLPVVQDKKPAEQSIKKRAKPGPSPGEIRKILNSIVVQVPPRVLRIDNFGQGGGDRRTYPGGATTAEYSLRQADLAVIRNAIAFDLRVWDPIPLPTFRLQTVTTTVSVPDGGTVILGGIKRFKQWNGIDNAADLDAVAKMVLNSSADPRSALYQWDLLEDMWGEGGTKPFSGTGVLSDPDAGNSNIPYSLQPNIRGGWTWGPMGASAFSGLLVKSRIRSLANSRRPRGFGFGPQITLIPEGAQMQVSASFSPQDELRRKQINIDRIRSDVFNEIKLAREMITSDPKGVEEQMKVVKEMVLSAPELPPAIRSQMVARVEAVLRRAHKNRLTQEELEHDRDPTGERRRLLNATRQQTAKKKQLMATFNAMMDEHRYQDAQREIAKELELTEPDSVLTRVSALLSRQKRNYKHHMALRQARQRGVLDTLRSVESSFLPFDDTRPILYPHKDVWRRLMEDREIIVDGKDAAGFLSSGYDTSGVATGWHHYVFPYDSPSNRQPLNLDSGLASGRRYDFYAPYTANAGPNQDTMNDVVTLAGASVTYGDTGELTWYWTSADLDVDTLTQTWTSADGLPIADPSLLSTTVNMTGQPWDTTYTLRLTSYLDGVESAQDEMTINRSDKAMDGLIAWYEFENAGDQGLDSLGNNDAIPTVGMVAHYKFEDVLDPGTDTLGANNGTPVGAPSVVVDAARGNVVSISGNSDNLVVDEPGEVEAVWWSDGWWSLEHPGDTDDILALTVRNPVNAFAGRFGQTTRTINKSRGYPSSNAFAGNLKYRHLYRAPRFTGGHRVFSNLLAYAPGMNTTRADIRATLEQEAKPKQKIAQGKIDSNARELLTRARKAGWFKLELDGKENRFTLHFDATGRYRYERTTADGLQEIVVCDGRTLRHAYPELGVAARRTMSRFHGRWLARQIPWLLPTAETLARGADLKHLGNRTIAIVPHWLAKMKRKDKKPVVYAQLRLIFAADGRLAERRVVEMPSGKTLLRATYAADGTVKFFNVKGKQLGKYKLNLVKSSAPSLKLDETKLVVVEMPLRTFNHVRKTLKFNPLELDEQYADLSEQDAIALVASARAEGQYTLPLQIVSQRFFGANRPDRRLGFYTLLASGSHVWRDKKLQPLGKELFDQFDPRKDHPNSPLAMYLAGLFDPGIQSDSKKPAQATKSSKGFLQDLATFRDLYRRRIQLAKGNSKDELRKALERQVIQFGKQAKSPRLAWAAASLLPSRLGAADYKARAEMFAHLKNKPGLAYFAKYEQARSLSLAGHYDGHCEMVGKLFTELYKETFEAGMLPPIDRSFRSALKNNSNHPWEKLMRNTADKLIEKKNTKALFTLAWQCRGVDDAALADELVGKLLGKVEDKRTVATTLGGIRYYWTIRQYEKADRYLSSLLKHKVAGRNPLVWLMAVRLADQRGRQAEAAARLEQALELVYSDTSGKIELEPLRKNYSALLDRYERLADTIAAPGARASDEMINRILGVADRWRGLEVDVTEVCQRSARIFEKLGAKELAWEYLTTPLAGKTKESGPWVSLAKTLSNRNQVDLADRAYEAAFEIEPTNAQILWDHAKMLQKSGRPGEALALQEKIAAGSWQPRFSSLKSNAARSIQALKKAAKEKIQK